MGGSTASGTGRGSRVHRIVHGTIAEKHLINPFIPFDNASSGAGKPVWRLLIVTTLLSGSVLAQSVSKPNEVTVDWNKTVIVSRSTPTLQVVVNPMLRAGAPIHDAAFPGHQTVRRRLRALCSLAAVPQARRR